jgi:hypothetical protein
MIKSFNTVLNSTFNIALLKFRTIIVKYSKEEISIFSSLENVTFHKIKKTDISDWDVAQWLSVCLSYMMSSVES